MDHIDTLVNRLRTYSQSLVAYKLDADFADACADNSMCECCVHKNSEDEEQFCDKNTIVYGCNQFEWRGLKEA